MPLDITWPPNSIVPPGGTSGAYDNLTVTGTFTAPGTFVIPGTFSPSSLSIPGTSALNGGGALVGTFSGSPVFSGTPSLSNGAAFTGTFSGNPTFSGNLTHQGTSALNGATTVGTNSAAASLISNGPAGSLREIQWNTAGSRRWRLRTNSTAESGGNAGSDFALVSSLDDGTNTTVAQWTRSTGAVEFFKDTTHSGTTHTFKGGIFRNQAVAYSGTSFQTGNYALCLSNNYTGTSADAGFFTFNTISGTDTVASAQSRGLLGITYRASTGTPGGVGLDVRGNDAATTGVGGYGMIGMRSTVAFNFNQGGTSSALVGANWALLLAMTDAGTGRYHNSARMVEMDMSIADSTNVGLKAFLKLNGDTGDTAPGLLDADYFIGFTRGNASGANWRYGLTFTGWDGLFPFDSRSTILDGGRIGNGYVAANGYKIAWGVDFNALDPQAGAFRSKGFLVDTDGTVQVGAMRASFTTGGGGTVDMSGIVASAIAYSSGGTGWVSGQAYMLADAGGNLVGMGVLGTVTAGVPNAGSISGGTVVRLPVLRTNVAPPATLTATAVKGASAVPPTDFTVSVTWVTTTAATTISINPTGAAVLIGKTGGSIGFNGTAAIAKPTVTGSRGANAALASLLTALANYGLLVDSSS